MERPGTLLRTIADLYKSLDNAKDTLCRNVTIYGKCRYEDKGRFLSSHGA